MSQHVSGNYFIIASVLYMLFCFDFDPCSPNVAALVLGSFDEIYVHSGAVGF